MILQKQPVAHHYIALRIGGDVLFVRDHDDRDPVLVELLKNCHNLDAGAAIEIAGWFIRKQHLWLVDQSARYGDALLLPSGKLAGMMILAAGESYRRKNTIRFLPEFGMR